MAPNRPLGWNKSCEGRQNEGESQSRWLWQHLSGCRLTWLRIPIFSINPVFEGCWWRTPYLSDSIVVSVTSQEQTSTITNQWTLDSVSHIFLEVAELCGSPPSPQVTLNEPFQHPLEEQTQETLSPTFGAAIGFRFPLVNPRSNRAVSSGPVWPGPWGTGKPNRGGKLTSSCETWPARP